MAANPKLRPIEIRRHRQDNHTYLMLHDPLQLSEQTILAPQPLAWVLAFCDGEHSPAEMVAAFRDRYTAAIDVELVEQLLQALDDALLLENGRSADAYASALGVYHSAPFRAARIAGQGYPADPKELGRVLDGWLAQVAPERLPAAETARSATTKMGLLSPHIDYARGWPVYAQVWQAAAREVNEADLVIVFGTDHSGNDAFTLTRQDYATPYGVLPTAQPVVAALASALGEEAAFAGELRHRAEHSLELVLVWLHHMRGGRPVEIAPILCGSFYSPSLNGATPSADLAIDRVLHALRTHMKGRKTVVVASGDLAHVGPAFGGQPLDTAARDRLRIADRELIQHMSNGDAEGFFGAIKRAYDCNNVCGVSPIYLTLRLLGDVRGLDVGYAVCPADEVGASAVTVSGVVFR